MITLKCNNCQGTFPVERVYGTLPMSVELKAYCTPKCLDDFVAKSKSKPDASV